jgi:two-component sensor histidine kinase
VHRNGAQLTVTVADEGRGLPASFDPAEQGGLGLQIVRTLVESELGGRLALRAGASGRGCDASVELPLPADPG